MTAILMLAILTVCAIVAAGICSANGKFKTTPKGKAECHTIHNSFGTTTITIRRR